MAENRPPPLSTEEIQNLLHQMQETTRLIAARLANQPQPPAPGITALVTPATTSAPLTHTSTSSSVPLHSMTSQSSSSTPLFHMGWGQFRNRRPQEFAAPCSNNPSPCSNDRVQENLSRLFRRSSTPPPGRRSGPQRGQKVPWNHIFVCLPEPDSQCVPNREEARFYEACGIGKKNIQFSDNQGDHTHLQERLYEHFPPLRDAGGFALGRSDRSKNINKIPIPPCGYTIPFLRHHEEVKRAPLYIIPLQRGLTLTTPELETNPVIQSCLGCGQDMPLCDIEKHLETCPRSNEELVEITSGHSSEDEDLPVAIFESFQTSHVAEEPGPEGTSDQSEESLVCLDDQNDQRQETESLTEVPLREEEPGIENDVKEILKTISSQLLPGPSPPQNNITVMRDTILESAFRAFRRQHLSTLHRLNVTFVDCGGTGEGAVDDGGPSREFLRLLIVSIRDSRYFTGPDDAKNLALVARGVENGDYKVLGKMLSMALVHGGIRPCFFSERLYCAMGSHTTPPVTLHEVDDYDLKEKLQKILDVETLPETQQAVMEASGALSLLGCSEVIQSMEQRNAFVDDAARAYVEGRTKAAREQLMEGLQTLGVGEAITTHHETLKTLFVGGLKSVTLEDMQKLFRVSFSEPGSNRRRTENQTLVFYHEWLVAVDEGTRPVTLGQILAFASAVETIPPLGFKNTPTIEFLHSDEGNRRVFPESNTCDVILRLPVHMTYELFVEFMESGILQSPTFGFI